MSNSTITGNTSKAVERHLGHSYKTVLEVSKNLKEIKQLGPIAEHIVVTGSNIEAIKAVATDIEDVNTVSDNMEYVKDVAAGIEGLPVVSYIGSEPPAQPVEGATWYCTTDGRTYVWYKDIDSYQWVESSPQSIAKEDVRTPIVARAALERALLLDGYTLVTGSFELGATLTKATDVILQEVTGKVYSWGGSFPATVPTGSTPDSTGGIGSNTWTLRSVPEVLKRIEAEEADTQDWKGFTEELLAQAGTTDNGQPDKLGDSQRVDALKKIHGVYCTVESLASGAHPVGTNAIVIDRDLQHFKVVSGGTPDGKALLDAGGAGIAVLQYSTETTIKSLGAKMNLIDDDAPYIDYMAKLYGYARCPLAGPYENFALGNQLTYGVLIASDIETKSFAVYDFGFNQVKIVNDASFTPDTNILTTFTVKTVWKNLRIVDSTDQTFIRTDDGTRVYQSCSIEHIDINKLRSLIRTEDSFGWFNLAIRHIKAIRLENLFDAKNGTGQTGNSVYDGLFQSTGALAKLENATVQCDFYSVNVGIGALTEQSQIVRYVGAVTNTASDAMVFTNCSFEYDDITVDTPILKNNPLTELTVIFDKCKILHKDVAGMNTRSFYPIITEGNRNSVSFVNGTREWWSRFAGAQGVYLKMISGILKECDLRYQALDIGTSWSRVFNIDSKFTMESNANITFTRGTYNVENNRLVVSFLGTARVNLVSGDTLYNFQNIPTFPQNIVHVGDYKIRAQASSGSIVTREAIPVSSQISGNLIIDLS